jgi:hypothetical protein
VTEAVASDRLAIRLSEEEVVARWRDRMVESEGEEARERVGDLLEQPVLRERGEVSRARRCAKATHRLEMPAARCDGEGYKSRERVNHGVDCRLRERTNRVNKEVKLAKVAELGRRRGEERSEIVSLDAVETETAKREGKSR